MIYCLYVDVVILCCDVWIVLWNFLLVIFEGLFSVIVGFNVCGKLILLVVLLCLLVLVEGWVVLDGRDIYSLLGWEVVWCFGLLLQSVLVLDGIMVVELVVCGCYLYQLFLCQWLLVDECVVVVVLCVMWVDGLVE